jgi:membrane protein DedA with SNARE-associated domain
VTTDHLTITRTLAFVGRHGYALLFAWVLAEQGAIPLPSIPLLLAAGALARNGRLNGVLAIACCLAAALIADTVWFQLGKRGGPRVLRFLCRVSLEPDSCVRQTENAFLKYGIRWLLVSKFIPGLNAVAAPLAGNSGTHFGRFLAYDAAGAVIWSGAYFSLGYVFSEQLEEVVASTSRMGSGLLILVVGVLTLWLAAKYVQRRRFLKQLEMARVTPEELRSLLNAGENLFIVDLRGPLEPHANTIPGATRMSPQELATRQQEIPRDRDVILVCN